MAHPSTLPLTNDPDALAWLCVAGGLTLESTHEHFPRLQLLVREGLAVCLIEDGQRRFTPTFRGVQLFRALDWPPTGGQAA